jgi:hypothetical protein
MRCPKIPDTHNGTGESEELNVQLKDNAKEPDEVRKVEEVNSLDRTVYLDRKEASDFLTRTTGKVITPEMISRFWRVQGNKYGGLVKYKSVLWMHESSLIKLMKAIRAGADLESIEFEKDLYKKVGMQRLDKVYISEKKAIDINKDIVQELAPMHYLTYLDKLGRGLIQ